MKKMGGRSIQLSPKRFVPWLIAKCDEDYLIKFDYLLTRTNEQMVPNYLCFFHV